MRSATATRFAAFPADVCGARARLLPKCLSLHVPAVALSLFDLGLRLPLAIGCERASNFYFFLELTFLVATNISPVAFFRFNDSALGRFAAFLFCGFFCGHLIS